MPPRWSAHEDRILRRPYADGTPLRAIAERVGRSEHAVAERRRTLGVPARGRQRAWSRHEDALLRAASASGLPAVAIAERMRRPADQVRRRRRALLGAPRVQRAFSAAEDAQIAARWVRNGDVDALSRAFGRTTGSVRLRAQKLGLHRPPARPRWRPHEDATLRDGYERGTELTGRPRQPSRRAPPSLA